MSFRKIVATILITVSLLTIIGGTFPAKAQGPYKAYLTGKIYDSGYDADGNGKFDYLRIGVEVNVSVAGDFSIFVNGLLTNESGYISVYNYVYASLGTGIHVVYIYLHGPTIYESHQNPQNVSQISLSPISYTIVTPFSPPPSPIPSPEPLHNVGLSRVYSYTEFDQPFNDMEAKFTIYPDGTVGLAGSSNFMHMFPYDPGQPLIDGVASITQSGSSTVLSTKYTVGMPPQMSSTFPYNSTIASISEEYSNERADTKIDATIPMAPEVAMQYPFNTTDFSLTANYSNDLVDAQISCNTTLPESVKSIYLLNITDFHVDGQYSNNQFSGVATVSMVSGFPLGTVNIDFRGNKTDLELTDSVHVVYGAFRLPPDQYMEVNASMLEHMLQFVSNNVSGRGPQSIYNMTMGALELTTFEWKMTDVGTGATVDYSATFHGDFIKLIALMASQGKNTLMYPLIDIMLSSAQTIGFQATYTHTTGQFSLRVDLSYNLRSLVDFFFKLPPNMTWYVIGGDSMRPTLERGDIILAENITDPSAIKADPMNGDIIVFHSPANWTQLIAARAINKTLMGGRWYFQTKGDNNPSPDPWWLHQDYIIGNVTARIPFIGAPLLGIGSFEEIPEVLDKTFTSIESASLTLTYSKTSRKLELKSTLTWNPEECWNATVPILAKRLPEMPMLGIPREVLSIVGLIFESLQNTTYCTLQSSKEYVTYQNGKENVEATYYFTGDINAQINYMKNYVISEWPDPLPWQMKIINQTSIDIKGLKVSFYLGNSSQTMSFDGIKVTPPRDMINATRFKLEQFFNLTSEDSPPPHSDERLKLIVEGGSNITHAVTITVPDTMPQPNETDQYRVVWYNQTISILKNLIFDIKFHPPYTAKIRVLDQSNNPLYLLPQASVTVKWPNETLYKSLTTNDFGCTEAFIIDYSFMPYGTYNIIATYLGASATQPIIFGRTGFYDIVLAINGQQVVQEITDSSTINATAKTGCKAVINQISKPATIAIRNTTLPSGVNQLSDSYKLLGNYVEIICNETNISLNVTLYFYYTDAQLSQLGLNEDSLTIQYWDAAQSKWIAVQSHINKEENYVWANVNHLSTWALTGQPAPSTTPIWNQPWFQALIIGVILAILLLAATVFMMKRKKPKSPAQPR